MAVLLDLTTCIRFVEGSSDTCFALPKMDVGEKAVRDEVDDQDEAECTRERVLLSREHWGSEPTPTQPEGGWVKLFL